MADWRRFLSLGGLIVAALLAAAPASAIDIQALMHDTQRTSQANNQMNLVWWIPTEFWKASLASNQQLTEQGRADMIKSFQDYTVFVLVHAKVGMGGLTDAASMEDLLMNTRLQVGQETIAPIKPEDINPTMSAILAAFKPVLANMVGRLGQSMQFLVYPNKNVGGKYQLDPTAPGSMQYSLYDQTFPWRLPLGSLLPKKIDPSTHEEFPGDYLYSPYTGRKLTVQ